MGPAEDGPARDREVRPLSGLPRSIVVVRAALVLAAAAAVVGALVLGGGGSDRATAGTRGRYVCPMHPEVAAPSASTCPICGMSLTPRGGASAAASAATVPLLASDLVSPVPFTPGQPRYSTDQVRHHVLRQELDAPAWVERDGVVAALLYKDELASLQPGEAASFFATARPAIAIAVHAATEAPAAWDRSMSLVRFYLDDRNARSVATPAREAGRPTDGHAAVAAPPLHTPGWVRLATRTRQTTVVPSLAVLQSADGPYVLALAADRRTVERRPVEIGKVMSIFTAIVGGVQLREQVVSTNAFFVDAERRLRADRGVTGDAAP